MSRRNRINIEDSIKQYVGRNKKKLIKKKYERY